MVDSATLPHWEERALHAVDDVSEHRLNFRGVYGCWEGGAGQPPSEGKRQQQKELRGHA